MINHLKQKVKGGGTIKLKTTTTLMSCINQNLKNRQDVFCVFVVNIFFCLQVVVSTCCQHVFYRLCIVSVHCCEAIHHDLTNSHVWSPCDTGNGCNHPIGYRFMAVFTNCLSFPFRSCHLCMPSL